MVDVSLITLGSPDQLTGGYLYHRRLADAASSHDARVGFVSAQLLRRAPRSVKASDVVVVDSIGAWRVLVRRSLRPRGVPLVASVHQAPGGIDHGRVRSALQAVLDRALYHRCTTLIAASQALGDELTDRHGLERQRVVVVAPGRDVAPPPPDLPDLGEGNRIALLSVGNWMRRKGTLELLEAFAALDPDEAVLHLVGRTDVQPRYTRRVQTRLAAGDLNERVVVHGAVSLQEVARLYAGAHVFVLPSYREPYGTVYGEALAAGLPVVGWRAGNLPHLIEHGSEGLLAEPGDIEGLSAALRLVVRDSARRNEMAEAAQRRGDSLPSWADTATAFFAALRRSMSPPP